ncbi:acyltransferase [Imhoffiella purpurea]|uniref:acyltransferase n=1 Tax=Imhoffiella purpurea TaxID=1249627 RepID=UPI0009DCCC32|nr:acyltransferase [Imhoffiella purpurea]
MAFLSRQDLLAIGFKRVGEDVLVSDKASIYDPGSIVIGNHSRIDDFCVISGNVTIGSNVHIAVFCNVAGGEEGVVFEDFSGLAYGCHVFSQSDDYSGVTLTNPTVPDRYKNESKAPVRIKRHSIVGACSIILPGVTLNEGTAVGGMSMVTKSTDAWSIYFGVPAKRIKSRSRGLLDLEKDYLASEGRE